MGGQTWLRAQAVTCLLFVIVVSCAHGAVPDPVRFLKSKSSDTSVSLQWSPPVSDGGAAVTKYTVYRASARGNALVYVSETASETFLDADPSLQMNRDYEYAVSASNADGESAFTTLSTRTSMPNTPPNWDEPTHAVYVSPGFNVTLPEIQGHGANDAVTVAFWVRPEPGSPPGVILEKRGADGTVLLSIETVDNAGVEYIRGTVGFKTSRLIIPRAVDVPLIPGKWVHITLRYDGTQLVVGCDEFFVNSGDLGYEGLDSLTDETGAFIVGTRANGSLPFSGYISGLKVYSRRLELDTVKERRHVFESLSDPFSEPELQAYFRLSEGQGRNTTNALGGLPAVLTSKDQWYSFLPTVTPIRGTDTARHGCASCVDDAYVTVSGSDGAREMAFGVTDTDDMAFSVAADRVSAGSEKGFYRQIASLRPSLYLPLDDVGSTIAHDRSGLVRHHYYGSNVTQVKHCAISSTRSLGCAEFSPVSTTSTLTYEEKKEWSDIVQSGAWMYGGLIHSGQPLTVAFWIQPTSHPVSDNVTIIGQHTWGIAMDFSLNLGFANPQFSPTTTYSKAQLPLNAWTHVIMSWSGADSTFWLNGTIVDTVADSGWTPTWTPGPVTPLQIGNCYGCSYSTNGFQGRLADVVIFDRFQNSEDISTLLGRAKFTADGTMASTRFKSALNAQPVGSRTMQAVMHGSVDFADPVAPVIQGRGFDAAIDTGSRKVTLTLPGFSDTPSVFPSAGFKNVQVSSESGCTTATFEYDSSGKVPTLTFMAVGSSREPFVRGSRRNPAVQCPQAEYKGMDFNHGGFTAFRGGNACQSRVARCRQSSWTEWPIEISSAPLRLPSPPGAIGVHSQDSDYLITASTSTEYQEFSVELESDSSTVYSSSKAGQSSFVTRVHAKTGRTTWFKELSSEISADPRGVLSLDTGITLLLFSVQGFAEYPGMPHVPGSNSRWGLLLAVNASSGDYHWHTTFTAALDLEAKVLLDRDGEVVVAGDSPSAVTATFSNGDTPTRSTNGRDVWVCRMDSNGTPVSHGEKLGVFGGNGDDELLAAAAFRMDGGGVVLAAHWDSGSGYTADFMCNTTLYSAGSPHTNGRYRDVVFAVDSSLNCHTGQAIQSPNGYGSPSPRIRALAIGGDSGDTPLYIIGSQPAGTDASFTNNNNFNPKIGSGDYVLIEKIALKDFSRRWIDGLESSGGSVVPVLAIAPEVANADEQHRLLVSVTFQGAFEWHKDNFGGRSEGPGNSTALVVIQPDDGSVLGWEIMTSTRNDVQPLAMSSSDNTLYMVTDFGATPSMISADSGARHSGVSAPGTYQTTLITMNPKESDDN